MVIDLSRLDRKTQETVDRIFRNDHDLSMMKAIKRQTAIAARNHQNRPRAREGFGARVLEIDAVIDSHWRALYGANYTDNKDLMKWLAQRNPEIKVHARGAKIQVGYQAGPQSRRSVGALERGACGK